ncbi:MAG: hypothetical protein AB1466_01880 [Actinomycetota bacterium]
MEETRSSLDNETDEEKFDRWLRLILTFKHLTREEVFWFVNELSRRFSFPRETLIKVFKREGML